MKVGIATWYKNGNFGGTLQAFALMKVLNSLNLSVEFIDYNQSTSLIGKVKRILMAICFPRISKTRQKIYSFVKENLPESPELNVRKELETYAQKTYDYAICGSDQIWANSRALPINDYYFLNFIDPEKRIAYAPSVNNIYPPFHSQFIKLLNSIKYLSIREIYGKKLLQKYTDKVIELVADPVLLLNSKQWNSYLKIEKSEQKQPYIFVYILRRSLKIRQYISSLSRATGLKIIAYNIKHEGEIRFGSKIAGPRDFIKDIQNAEYIVTDSYHGFLFSLIFEKKVQPFLRWSKDNDMFSQNARLLSIFDTLNINKEMLDNYNIEWIVNNKNDYSNISERIYRIRERSITFLATAIGNSNENQS